MIVSILANVICISFFLGISYNMIMLINSQRKHYALQEVEFVKSLNKKRIKRVIIFTVLMPIMLFLLYLTNYLIKRQ